MEIQYIDLLKDILDNGVEITNRTGINTLSLFGKSLRCQVDTEFPLITTAYKSYKNIIEELIWFLNGDTNVNHLISKGVNIWRSNTTRAFLDSQGLTYPEYIAGPIYGYQWRNWNKQYDIDQSVNSLSTNINQSVNSLSTNIDQSVNSLSTNIDQSVNSLSTNIDQSANVININSDINSTDSTTNSTDSTIDQLMNVIEELKKRQHSRRLVVSAWNPGQLREMVLPPCHVMFQFMQHNDRLSMTVYQRSVDVPLGLPYNIASYATLLCLVAKITNLHAYELIYFMGDCHIYKNQIEGCLEQIKRQPYESPILTISDNVFNYPDLKGLIADMFKITNYKYHPTIKFPFAT